MCIKIVLLLAVLFSLTTWAQSLEGLCNIINNTKIVCDCAGSDEEFYLPENKDYRNLTSLKLSSCKSANLHFSSIVEASRIEEIIVQNITDELIFELFLTSKMIRRFELTNVHRIPMITPDTFATLTEIDTFILKNLLIESFAEKFTKINVNNFIMEDVTIMSFDGLNIDGKGQMLKIKNSTIFNNHYSQNYINFSRVEILNSIIVQPEPGRVHIAADSALMMDNTFSNLTLNLQATENATVISTCADGNSSLSVGSSNIRLIGNRLPEDIHYAIFSKNDTLNPTVALHNFFGQNNTICIGGKCKCHMRNGKSSSKSYSLGLVLICWVFVSLIFNIST